MAFIGKVGRPGFIAGNAFINGGFMAATAPPTVLASDIYTAHGDRIVIIWNRPVVIAGDLKEQIDIIINGAPPVHPTSIVIHGNRMILTRAPAPAKGDTVVWRFNDKGTATLGDNGGLSARTIPHIVNNPWPHAADATHVHADTTHMRADVD